MTAHTLTPANDDPLARLIFTNIRPSRADLHDDDVICFMETNPVSQRVLWRGQLRLLAAQLPFRNHRALSHWDNDNFGGDAA